MSSKDPAVGAGPASEAVLVSEVIPASPERIFSAWLSSEQHRAITGDEAVIDPVIGGQYSVQGGRARGTVLGLELNRRILLSFRAEDFPESCPDSTVEVTLEETGGGTLMSLLHSNIPAGQSDRYRESWMTRYLEPWKGYFTGRVSNGVHPADTKALGHRKAASRPNGVRTHRPADRQPARAARKAKVLAKGTVKAKAKAKPAVAKASPRAAAKKPVAKSRKQVGKPGRKKPVRRPGKKKAR